MKPLSEISPENPEHASRIVELEAQRDPGLSGTAKCSAVLPILGLVGPHRLSNRIAEGLLEQIRKNQGMHEGKNLTAHEAPDFIELSLYLPGSDLPVGSLQFHATRAAAQVRDDQSEQA